MTNVDSIPETALAWHREGRGAVLATELGPERQLGGAELIRLAHGFARCQR